MARPTINPLYLKPSNWPAAAGLGVLRIFHLLPHRLKVNLCQKLGTVSYRFFKKRRHVVDVNLRLCFPQMSEAERKTFALQTFSDWGVSLVETAMGWFGASSVLDDMQVIGAEHFEAALARQKGVILLGAHFTTIDLGSTLFRKRFGHDTPVHVVYRDQKNELFNHVMSKCRLRNASTVIPKHNMRQIVRHLRAREVIWYAPDHDFGEQSAVFVPFFGHPAATLTTTSKLSAISKSPVVMMSHFRNPEDNSYTLKFSPALENFPSGDEEADARAVNELIEQAILDAPTQYMWIHKRFKTQAGKPRNALYAKAN